MLLKEAGYSVLSVVGNEAGMRAARGGKFAMFIVGHAAPEPERVKMVRWLKENYPNIPVLALQASVFSDRQFADADCVANADDPKEWLQAVAECLKR